MLLPFSTTSVGTKILTEGVLEHVGHHLRVRDTGPCEQNVGSAFQERAVKPTSAALLPVCVPSAWFISAPFQHLLPQSVPQEALPVSPVFSWIGKVIHL